MVRSAQKTNAFLSGENEDMEKGKKGHGQGTERSRALNDRIDFSRRVQPASPFSAISNEEEKNLKNLKNAFSPKVSKNCGLARRYFHSTSRVAGGPEMEQNWLGRKAPGHKPCLLRAGTPQGW